MIEKGGAPDNGTQGAWIDRDEPTPANAWARAEHDLSGSNMYSEVTSWHSTFNDAIFTNYAAVRPATRYSASAETHYFGGFVISDDLQDDTRIAKNVAGTATSLVQTNTPEFSTYYNGATSQVVRQISNGSVIIIQVDSDEVERVTDSSITSGTRAGMNLYWNRNWASHIDDWLASDLRGGGARNFVAAMNKSKSGGGGGGGAGAGSAAVGGRR
jgi:hypothetical protein